MSLLSVPDMGLQLESSPNFLPMQAFGITLDDGVIEDMIRCVQNGQKIELAVGKNPTLRYGGQEEHIEPNSISFDYDLYLSNPSDSTSKAQRLEYPTMSILRKPSHKLPKPDIRTVKVPVKGSKQPARAGSPGSDSDSNIPISSSYPKAKTEKRTNGTKSANGIIGKGPKSKHILPPGKSAMAAALSGSTTRSLPSSPALNGVASPSHNPIHSATQDLLQKNKGERTALVHELAIKDQSYEYLKSRWGGSDADLKTQLSKVADLIGDKWSMKKMYWKELDVWNYDYDGQADRQKAIDNAIKAYDKQRLGTTAPEWERLLKKEDRGKGIVLSKLQANIAKGNITAAPKMCKADDGSKNDSDSSKGKGGEAMARSNSQPVGSKAKSRVSEREAQTKRFLSTNPKKAAPAPKKAPVSKVKAADKQPAKRVLSEETIQDSSSDDEAPPPTKSKQQIERVVEKLNERPERPVEKGVERAAEKVVEKRKPSPAVAPKPKAKPAVRAPKVMAPRAPTSAVSSAPKRPRDDDDSSSSSGTPLSKRLKPKETAKPLSTSTTTSLKHRPSDASVNSRGTASSTNFSAKSKNTSPAKSSPLASSPPTNASDLEDNTSESQSQSQSRPHTNGLTNGNGIKKRKERDQEQMPAGKKPRVTREVLEKARKFDMFYKKYAALHHNLTASKDPSQDSLDDLMEMHNRLVKLKTEIMEEVAVQA